MSHLIDTVSVSAALLVSVGYAVMSLGPRALRRRMVAAAGAWLAYLPAVWGVRQLRARVQRAAQGGGGACGGCDNCGAASPAPGGRSEDAISSDAGSPEPIEGRDEVRVPLSRIGRRAVH